MDGRLSSNLLRSRRDFGLAYILVLKRDMQGSMDGHLVIINGSRIGWLLMLEGEEIDKELFITAIAISL